MKQSLPKEKPDWNQIWEKNKIPVSLGLVGLVLISLGLLTLLIFQQKEAEIEILPASPVDELTEETTLFVDLAGAVERPGVYELPSGSRVNELLIQAGGLSASADREWVGRNLNLAQKLADGVKIYIPREGERVKEQESGRVAGSSATMVGKININTATASELDSLWGIGEKRAADIIKNRPYQSIEELKTKKIIPSNVYERIKDEIMVF